MAPIITISAPSHAYAGEWFIVSGILYDSVTGMPITNVVVFLKYNSGSLGSAITGIDGDYLDEVKINRAGTWTLKAVHGDAKATTTITIEEVAPELPDLQIENLTYPATANPGDTVNINWGTKNQGGNPGYPQWTRLIDEATNQEIHREDFTLATNESRGIFTTWTMPATTWNLRIEAGYNATLTATKSLKMGAGAEIPLLVPLALIVLLGYAVFRK